MWTFPIRAWVMTVALLVPVYMTGCVSSPVAPVRDTPDQPSEVEAIKEALYGQLDRWQGTRYRLGGLGRGGIDCSGLTYVVYRDLFGKHLPRTTDEQGRVGRGVHRRALVPGDLVFFKTGMFQKHVGIYVEDGLFMHASKSGGVQISSLDRKYWRKRYWKARRMSI